MTKRAIIYARVSTKRQADDGLPVESQLEHCRAKAAALGAEVCREFVDGGLSGSTDRRPAFQDALNYCAVMGCGWSLDGVSFARVFGRILPVAMATFGRRFCVGLFFLPIVDKAEFRALMLGYYSDHLEDAKRIPRVVLGFKVTTKFSRDAKRHRLQRVVRTHARGTTCGLKR